MFLTVVGEREVGLRGQSVNAWRSVGSRRVMSVMAVRGSWMGRTFGRLVGMAHRHQLYAFASWMCCGTLILLAAQDLLSKGGCVLERDGESRTSKS